jgi:hypothetical protein
MCKWSGSGNSLPLSCLAPSGRHSHIFQATTRTAKNRYVHFLKFETRHRSEINFPTRKASRALVIARKTTAEKLNTAL